MLGQPPPHRAKCRPMPPRKNARPSPRREQGLVLSRVTLFLTHCRERDLNPAPTCHGCTSVSSIVRTRTLTDMSRHVSFTCSQASLSRLKVGACFFPPGQDLGLQVSCISGTIGIRLRLRPTGWYLGYTRLILPVRSLTAHPRSLAPLLGMLSGFCTP